MRAARWHAVVAAILPLRREVPPVAAGGLRRSARRRARDGGRCAGGQRGRGEPRNLCPLVALRVLSVRWQVLFGEIGGWPNPGMGSAVASGDWSPTMGEAKM